MDGTITIRGVGKQFRRYHADRPRTIKEALILGLRGCRPVERFWALRDVSLDVRPGEMVGMIGRNGAGKSTLLRLVGGVGRPDEGSVEVRGRVGALLDLGTGFHPDLTGRENVFVAGVIAGLTRREVAERFATTVAFAELEAAIDSPLRTYSTGMQMRLAFAVAAHTDPSVLLIDEVLAVGDLAFQHKCLDRIAQFRRDGCAILLVSHDTSVIRELCDEAIWLRAGQIAARGPASAVVDQYVAEVDEETKRRTPTVWPAQRTPNGAELHVHQNRLGSLELQITAVHLLDRAGAPVAELDSGAALSIVIDYQADRHIPSPIFYVTISRTDGLLCCEATTDGAGLVLPDVQGQGQIVLQFERLDLNGGQYFVEAGAYEREWTYAYDYHWGVYPLMIRGATNSKSILRPPLHWKQGDPSPSHTPPPPRQLASNNWNY